MQRPITVCCMVIAAQQGWGNVDGTVKGEATSAICPVLKAGSMSILRYGQVLDPLYWFKVPGL